MRGMVNGCIISLAFWSFLIFGIMGYLYFTTP